jgi:hypothetical protein
MSGSACADIDPGQIRAVVVGAPVEASPRHSSCDEEEPTALGSKMIQFFADQQLSQSVSTVPPFLAEVLEGLSAWVR